ncbi:MAG: RNA polymerase sigma factor [Planctomycetota bacterium]|jgi:RNA polymerase sigma-70 factor (ECF subfamily)
MKYHDQTDMGGAGETFLTTHWSLIDDIQAHEDQDRALIGLLIERYWKPVYFYLRRRGYGNEKAKDLAQGFFHEIVLNRRLTQRADQSKGRFRSLLLHALKQYLIDVRHKESARKRIPKEKLVSLDQFEIDTLPEMAEELAPEESYNYGWLSALLDRILAEVETECAAEGLQTHWKIFHDRIVAPLLRGASPPPLKTICSTYGVENEKKASNMTISVKRRFQTVLKRHVRSTVVSEGQVGEEVREILQFFPKDAQHPE